MKACRRDIRVGRLVAVVFDVCGWTLEGLEKDRGREGFVGAMRLDDLPFVADGESAVDEFAQEGFGVGCYGDDDWCRDRLGEGLIDEFADGFAFEADAAVCCVAFLLRGRHEFHEHSKACQSSVCCMK